MVDSRVALLYDMYLCTFYEFRPKLLVVRCTRRDLSARTTDPTLYTFKAEQALIKARYGVDYKILTAYIFFIIFIFKIFVIISAVFIFHVPFIMEAFVILSF